MIQFKLAVLLGTGFGLLASLMAFLIFYEEYRKHFVDSRRARREALSGAMVTFLFFFGLAIVAAFWLLHLSK